MIVSDLPTGNALTGPGPGSKVTGYSGREGYPDLQAGSGCLLSNQTKLRSNARLKRGEPALMAPYEKTERPFLLFLLSTN